MCFCGNDIAAIMRFQTFINIFGKTDIQFLIHNTAEDVHKIHSNSIYAPVVDAHYVRITTGHSAENRGCATKSVEQPQ